MNIRQALISQFHHPRGTLGRVAGWIMATRPSNLQRNQWAVDLLELEPGDHVLELGPGPGATLRTLLRRLPTGRVTALDHSETMLDACRRANREALGDGRLTLVQGEFTELPGLPGPFDKILAVNSLQFDAMNEAALSAIVSLLRPGGCLAIAFQPRAKGSDDRQAQAFGDRVAELLAAVGLRHIRCEVLPLEPVNAVCVLGYRSNADADPSGCGS